MHIYIAGPMSGRPKFNYPAFDQAAFDVRMLGHTVSSPAEMDDPEIRATALRSRTGNLDIFKKKTGESWGDFLSRDVKLIADSEIEAIALLPEWETSKGARLEAFVGIMCGYPLFFLEGDKLIEVTNDRVMGDIHESVSGENEIESIL